MTLDEIVRRNALRFPAKPALLSGTTALSWSELNGRVNRLANAFVDRGLAAGDRIAVLLSNCPEYFEIYFACARTGVIPVPLNYRLTAGETAGIVNHAEPSLFLVGADHIDQARGLEGEVPADLSFCVVGRGTFKDAVSYGDMVQAAPDTPCAPRGSERDPFAIFYTSGTTGLPKGAMVSHLNLEMNGYNQMLADRSVAGDINLVSTPIYHVGAVFVAVTYMMLGCTQVILPRFEPGAWLEAMQQSRSTVALLIPTMMNGVLNHPNFSGFDLSALRLIFYGGGPMPPAVLERAMQGFGCGFTQGYGLTETLEATFLTSDDHVMNGTALQQRRLHSAGREAVGAEVRIIDDDGADLPAGEIGEILVRSRSVIPGYWKLPGETENVIRNGWFHTGDMGYLDEDRYLFVVDRKKDMVVSGGVNIYTKEIESVLYTHPAVLEAAVFGLADEQWGEIVCAAVVLKPGMDLNADMLIDLCRARLAGFKKPRRVFFVDELPKNPSGKILKRELRQHLGAAATVGA